MGIFLCLLYRYSRYYFYFHNFRQYSHLSILPLSFLSFFLKMGHSRPLLLYFRLFDIIFCWWLDSNCVPLDLEATTLPTEPQPLPFISFFNSSFFSLSFSHFFSCLWKVFTTPLISLSLILLRKHSHQSLNRNCLLHFHSQCHKTFSWYFYAQRPIL